MAINEKEHKTGKLKIGDSWNAITIIALSQNNPLKAIAEFVENSIDAKAGNITIQRGKERNSQYLKIIDDGEGITPDDSGMPDFKYVATHICDSIKKRLKEQGMEGIQGEFGIGLLSFWTVGEQLLLTSAGSDNKIYQMIMRKGDPGYSIREKKRLMPFSGTEILIQPLLAGVKNLSGEKIQNYLASELRDRIKKSGVKIRIIDRVSRKEMYVEPRKFTGRLLHDIKVTDAAFSDIYIELYLCEQGPDSYVGLYKNGTRVLPDIRSLDEFSSEPWTSGLLQGIVDVPFLNLTPGTRDGIIRDDNYERFCGALAETNNRLREIISEQKQAEEEQASRNILKTVQKAFREAFFSLPREEYDWFRIYSGRRGNVPVSTITRESDTERGIPAADVIDGFSKEDDEDRNRDQLKFFEHPGPLYKAVISPRSSIVKINETKTFRVIPRDRKGTTVEADIDILWAIKDGDGAINDVNAEIIEFKAPDEPCLVTLGVTVGQNDISCEAEAVITVTDSILSGDREENTGLNRGLPGYTFQKAPGQLWRSRYDDQNNIIIINNGHKDYVFASRNSRRKIRYICKLFSKELVLQNFPGIEPGQLLERLVELTLYSEENL